MNTEPLFRALLQVVLISGTVIMCALMVVLVLALFASFICSWLAERRDKRATQSEEQIVETHAPMEPLTAAEIKEIRTLMQYRLASAGPDSITGDAFVTGATCVLLEDAIERAGGDWSRADDVVQEYHALFAPDSSSIGYWGGRWAENYFVLTPADSEEIRQCRILALEFFIAMHT